MRVACERTRGFRFFNRFFQLFGGLADTLSARIRALLKHPIYQKFARKKHHHHHSKVKLGNEAALDDQAIVNTHKNERSVKQTHAASDLDSLVFEEIDVEAISSERGKKRSSRGTE